MTKRASVTQAQICRMIRAALYAGQHVIGVTTKPDGTVTIETAPLAPSLEQELLEKSEEVVL